MYDPDIFWNPKLLVENVLGEPKESIWYSVVYEDDGQAHVLEKRRVRGNFLEFMELNQFPFDTQVCTCWLTGILGGVSDNLI